MRNGSTHRVSSGALAAVLAIGSANAAASGPSSARVRAAEPGRIVVLGDSLAVSPSHNRNFVAELQSRLDASGSRWTVVNAGIRGDQTSGGLWRADALLTPDTRILVLELGVNDGLRGLDAAAVEKNLAAIIERAQSRGITVLLCGMLVPPRFGWKHAIDFQAIFPRLAQNYNLPLVPFLLEGVALNPDMNGPDGIHPNLDGARRIADTVWPYLEPLVLTPAARQ